MPKLLFTSVGGTAAPVINALKAVRPERAVFVISEQSRRTCEEEVLPAIEQDGLRMPAGAYSFIQVPHHEDLREIVHALRPRVLEETSRWRAMGDDYGVVVDITGGTKQMSAGLALVAQRLDCEFFYTGGRERGSDGLGTVVDGAEESLRTVNPWDILGYMHLEDAQVLFNRGHYTAACEVLELGKQRADESGLKRRFDAFIALARAFELWERFVHDKAREKLEKAVSMGDQFRAALDSDRALVLLGNLKKNLDFLKGRSTPGWLVIDLYANALRRQREGRYDDAVARIYRAMEALAQDRLRDVHGIADTSEVPANALPDNLRKRWQGLIRHDSTLMLSLQQDYLLLEGLGDDLGLRFREIGLAGEKSPLNKRNHSILAHGFKAVSEKDCRKLVEKLDELSGIDKGSLPIFPIL